MSLSIALIACGEEGSSNDSTNDQDNTEESTDDAEETSAESADEPAAEESSGNYGIGDIAEIDGVKFTLKSVSTTDERNEFEEVEPNMVVKVEYEIENTGEEEIPVGGDLQVYDGTGNQMDSYALDNTLGSLQPGKKMQGQEHFGVEEGPIEIYFAPMISFEDPAIFEAEIQ